MSAIEAARRFKAGQPLDGCPHVVILELLQELELLAAEATLARDEIARLADSARARATPATE